jgi:D-arabinose 1-dehydrogenase-like Zn-dependent alcohol dehydrogenase
MTTNLSPTKYDGKTSSMAKAAEIEKANAGLRIVERAKPVPQHGEVRLKIKACGVCHSDSFAMTGGFPGQIYPVIPGHEIAGVIDEIGSGAVRFKIGDRVGVGWHGGHCGHCESCRSGDFITCSNLQIPGINRDGGYAEYAVFSEAVCAALPDKIDFAEAAPLLCAGITTFNALRHSGAKPGDVVAILGVGGLGHLGVQWAAKMGFKTVAIARGMDKAQFAKQLGAAVFIDSESKAAVDELKKLGGAKVILSTVTNSKAVSPWIEGLSIDGKLMLVGADFAPMEVSPIQLLGERKTITGWPSGTGHDSEECLKFAELTGVRPLIERFPFTQAKDAYDRMMSGKARFRAVIELE